MEFIVRVVEAGRVQQHSIEAVDITDAKKKAVERYQQLLSISLAKQRNGKTTYGGSRKFSVVDFSDELTVLLEAGLTVVEACEAIAEKSSDSTSTEVLLKLIDLMREGRGFSGSLEAMPAYFSPLYVSIVRSAERTSNLSEVLKRFVEHEVRLKELKSKVIRASVYPAVLGAVGFLVTLFLLGYVVPRFAAVYTETGRPLPLLTKALLSWGRFSEEHTVGLAFALLLVTVTLWYAIREAKRSGLLSKMIFSLPLISPHVRTFQLARLYLTLGMVLEGGIPILQALSLASGTLGDALRPALERTAKDLRHGVSISQAFGRHELATSMAIRMLKVGERSGQMGSMMSKISDTYSRDVSRAIDWFSRVFEPLLMIVIGLVIGTVVVMLYMPIFDLAGSLR